MFLQEGPAETFTYMVLGLGVILGTILLFVLSVWARMRSLRRDLAVLGEMESSARWTD